MTDRRHAKAARARAAKAKGQGRQAPRRRTHRSWGAILRGLAWLFAPAVASALLLTLAFPSAEVSWLAYVALVPLLVTAVRARTGKDAFAAALVAGIVFFAINVYWVRPVTLAAYLAAVPYLALYWAAWALVVRWSTRLRVPLAVSAPVVWVALEWIRGWAVSGLPWLFVGHTQYENLVLIQTADTLGAYGQSALCLATTGFLAAALVRPLVRPRGEDTRRQAALADKPPVAPTGPMRLSPMLLVNLVVVGLAWAGTVGYGLYRLSEAPSADAPGPVVASVQTNVPQEIKLQARLEQIEQLEERLIREQCDLTDRAMAQAAQAGLDVDLVVWPETMVPGILNREYLTADIEQLIDDPGMQRVFLYLQNRSRGYWLRLRQKAHEVEAPILFGGHAVDLKGAYRLPGGGFFTRGPRRNTAFLISRESRSFEADHRYAKCHLVPFGEYVPFKASWPWLHRVLLAFTPYDFDHSLTPGANDQPPFRVAYDGREARFQVAICYEDAMAYRIREMVRASASRERQRAVERPAPSRSRLVASPSPKAVDFIVNISNDGWFSGSWELDQHLNLCVFRAVENRVPIVRSVNTGISAIIQSTGRIAQVVEQNGERRGVEGCIVGQIQLDDRLTPYTRHGDLFADGCMLATAGLLVAAAVARARRRKATADESEKEQIP